MSVQPSASRTALLLFCPRPFEVETEPDEADEPARYGSAFHQVLAACLRSPSRKPLERNNASYAREIDRAARRYEVRPASAELAGHVKGSAKVFRNWLAREKLEIIEIEQAHGIWPKADGSWKTRKIPPHDDDHRYRVAPGEMGATVDIVAASANRRRLAVVDHKTGMHEDWHHEDANFSLPKSLGQMRTLGLVGAMTDARRTRAPDLELGIFHADRRGLPIVYSEPYEPDEQIEHAKVLHAALARVGQGFLRPGAHCARCPVRETCPGYASNLISEGTAALIRAGSKLACEPIDPKALYALPTDDTPLGAPLEERAAVLYELIRRFDSLAKAGHAEIKRLVQSGKIIETSDGRVLTLRSQTFETLSKKSVLDALGAIDGERELKRLRAKGAIRESTRELLVSDK